MKMDTEGLQLCHDALKPIAERAPGFDDRRLATIIMRLIEAIRGDEKKTELPPSHHK
jgi:hypothetical protein